jgi:PAS domain S-box-containing protein
MLFKTPTSRFEIQVHLGLLAIIFVLILLNFVSNYVTYNARTAEKKILSSTLQVAAVAISRTLANHMPNPSDSTLRDYKREYNLSNIIVIPSQPANSSKEARKEWFIDFVHRFPAGQVPEVARKILGSEYNTLTRGENDEYFLVYPVPSRGSKYLMILSVNSAELAYLDDSGDKVLATTVVTTILIVFTYYLLVRYIFRPFRKLRQQAVESGRIVSTDRNEADAVAEDYRVVINELKEKEQKLIDLNKQISRRATSLEQFNQYLLKSTNSGIVTIDREGRVLSINDSAAEIIDIVPSHYISDSFETLFGAKSEIASALRALIQNHENRPYTETTIRSHGGKEKTVGYTVSTVADDHQQPIGASVILTDINELAGLRRELEAKNRLAALGEMSGGLAHQLRNSIGSIVGFCNLLKKQQTSDRADSSYFDELFAEVKETESLVRRFLSFARPLEFQPEEINVVAMIEELVSSYVRNGGQLESELQAVVRYIGPKTSVLYSGDALLLKQVLSNIIDNAITACAGKQGVIEINLEKQNSSLTITITDNGTGIPEEDLEKVFTPFYSSKPSGTGLGLPLAGKIIDLHGGHITVESKVGVGTTFRIHLPVRVNQDSLVIHT